MAGFLKKIKSAFKIITAILSAPAVFVIAFGAAKSLLGVFLNFIVSMPFALGFAGYAVMDLFFYRPVKSYVLIHELTHAMAARLSGFKVKKILVKSMGGYVETDGGNGFTALAPYLIPVYAVLTAIVFGLLSLKWENVFIKFTAVMLFGFFLSFHLMNTFRTLYEKKQSDIKHGGGIVFSLVLIIFANSIFLIFSFEFLYPQITVVSDIFKSAVVKTLDFWVFIAKNTAVLALNVFKIIF